MTRDEAIKRLYELQFYCASESDAGENGSGIWQEDIDALDMAIAALREQPQWISVEDELPSLDATKTDDFGRQKSVRVLCVCKQKSGKVFVKEGYYVVWAGDDVYWRIPGSIDSVTHWMPLPEPPEVEG